VGTFPGAAKTLNAPVWLMPQKDIALQGSQTNLKRMIEAARLAAGLEITDRSLGYEPLAEDAGVSAARITFSSTETQNERSRTFQRRQRVLCAQFLLRQTCLCVLPSRGHAPALRLRL